MAVFQVPKHKDFTVMSNHHLKNRGLSLKAKGLQSLMLSLPEGWDYSLAGLAHICRDGLSSIRGAITELEEQGYLRRRRLRNEKGQLTDTEYTILELPDPPAPGPICENRTQLSTQPSSIQKENILGSSIHPINPPSSAMDSMDGIIAYRDFIMDNIEYDILLERYGHERLDEVVELVLETVLSRRETIRIDGDEYPREVVKSRLLKLTSSHIEYVFDALDKNTTKVRNIKQYLLTALYNAPATIDSFYRTAVNHDLYGG